MAAPGVRHHDGHGKTAAAMVGGFYLTKFDFLGRLHILDRPDQWCAINNIAAPVGDQTTDNEVQLPNTMEHPTLPLSWLSTTKNMVFCLAYELLININKTIN